MITEIYDQSGEHNDLTVAPAGHAGFADGPAPAGALPVVAGGHAVYGVSMSGGMGYRDNATKGVPTGSRGEGIYLVASGTHYNDKCCFDYGNAEPSNTDTGGGHMAAVYFGTSCWFKPCRDGAPRVMADFENGLFQSDGGESRNPSYAGNATPFVTAMLKDDGVDHFAIEDGDARSGPLSTEYSGKLPSYPGYAPTQKEGAIILGIGGDNSNGGVGSFFEGVLTAGQPSDATDRAVQANIVAVGYRTAG